MPLWKGKYRSSDGRPNMPEFCGADFSLSPNDLQKITGLPERTYPRVFCSREVSVGKDLDRNCKKAEILLFLQAKKLDGNDHKCIR